MKKKRPYIFIFVVIVIINLGIYFKNELKVIVYDYVKEQLRISSIGNTYILIAITPTETATLREGKRTITLKSLDTVEFPVKDEYINRNCVISYDKKNSSNYWIDVYNQPEVEIQSENASGIKMVVYTNGDALYSDASVTSWGISHMEVSVHEHDILFQSEDDFGQNTEIYTSIEKISLQQLDFEVHSFEMRKNAEGRYRMYLDMDGDGVYEREYGEYTEKRANKENAQEKAGSGQ